MNPRDRMIQSLTTTVMVPKFEAFSPLDQIGHRFLVAEDGLWLEVRRAWLYARTRIAAQKQVAMPYGAITNEITFLCPPIPTEEIRRFSAIARRDCPKEAAGWVVWNEHSDEYRFIEVEVIDASGGHIRYHRPILEGGEHLVLDLHSHGSGRAFFSGTDNKDDRGEIKISGVIGRCNQSPVDMAFRLCLLGVYIELEAHVVAYEDTVFAAKKLGGSDETLHQI